DKTLDEGVQLQRWWEAVHAKGSYDPKFDVIREFNNDDSSFGFFGVAPVGGRDLPVMGIVQEMFYDRQKQATGQTIQPQLKEFVLKHFMRVSHFRQPEAAPAGLPPPPAWYLRLLSWLPEDVENRVGFGYEQLYYKRRGTGEIGKFSEEEKHAIVD